MPYVFQSCSQLKTHSGDIDTEHKESYFTTNSGNYKGYLSHPRNSWKHKYKHCDVTIECSKCVYVSSNF